MAGLLIFGAASIYQSLDRECFPGSDAVLSQLTSDDILDSHPAASTPDGDLYTGCETDDHYLTVGRSFETTDEISDVVAFYTERAQSLGWTPVEVEALPSSVCFSRPVANTMAYYSVNVENARAYYVNISAAETAAASPDVLC
ncbi:hypothetical protein [Acrocarpospora phusangensis]|nr:hypothetical protein [Acrocarpospora phusangensis]